MKYREQYIEKAINNKKYCRTLCEELEANKSYFYDAEGFISEETLFTLIELSNDNDFAYLLSTLSPFLKREEVTPESFKRIMQMNSSWKNSILIGLCHANLSLYQLNELYLLNIDNNPMLAMLKILLKENCFTAFDVFHLITSNLDNLEDIKYLCDNFLDFEIEEKKKKILQQFQLID